MSNSLEFYAGEKAFSLIMDNGLSPDMVDIVAGASGGPRWLVLSGLDRAIFGYWFRERTRPLHLIGSSIGSWRFAAAAARDIESTISVFEDMYINQRYSSSPSAKEVSDESRKILNAFLSDNADYILNHPFMRLNVISVKNRIFPNMHAMPAMLFFFGCAALLNIVSRKSLGILFKRALFHSQDDTHFKSLNDFPVEIFRLTENSLEDVLLSSGSIPFVMDGVTGIDGASKAVYRDGGIIDYHLDIPFASENGIVLYPHFFNRIIPGWLDKSLKWRKPKSKNVEDVLIVCPSQEFIDSLPCGKIPDRNDFKLFKGRDNERIKYWQEIQSKNKIMGDEFLEAVESGRIKNILKKLDSR